MPRLLNIFANRPFQAVELTNAMNLITPIPTLLGTLGTNLFNTVRSRTRQIAVYRKDNIARLVPVSPIGAPPVQLERAGAKMDSFYTRRLAKATTIYAENLQGVLLLPDFQAVPTMQGEVARDSVAIRDDIELTEEHMRFGAIQGKVLDADGTTVLDDWYANWGVSVPAAVNFHLDVTTTNLREIADTVKMLMFRASKGAWVQGVTRVAALAGDTFFKDLINHPTIVAQYMNWAAAADLRGEMPDFFDVGGIRFYRYLSEPTYDLAIPADEVRFFPIGAREVFQRVMGPAEFDPFVNQPGRDIYALTIPDTKRGAFVMVEQYNYPLYMCLRPELLQRGVGR